jgi:hypothetical protein
MQTQTNLRSFAYWIVLAGLLLAIISAIVPFYTAGYKLMYGVLLAGMLPYLVYGIAAALLRRGLMVATGLVLLTLHAWLVISERFLGGGDYSDGMIYSVPLLLALALLPLLVLVLRQPY